MAFHSFGFLLAYHLIIWGLTNAFSHRIILNVHMVAKLCRMQVLEMSFHDDGISKSCANEASVLVMGMQYMVCSGA